jgi:acyl-CoA reductase-like NAD-dependent aldehyde dehydrogenase
MDATMLRGNLAIPERHSTDRVSTVEEQDRALRELGAGKDRWARRPIPDRIELLDRIAREMEATARRWVAVESDFKGYRRGSREAAIEWFGGPVFVLRTARLLRESLRELDRRGHTGHGPVRTRADGRTTVQVFPTDAYDRLTYAGYRSEVWLERDDVGTLPQACPGPGRRGEVCLILGGGNISGLQPMDILHQLFVENRVVLLKCSPVQEHVAPVLGTVLRSLIDADALRIVYGGADVAARLAHHPGVDRLHMTGSDKTYDALVWGSGEEGRRRKADRRPLLTKPFTAELGQVSPVVVVPGPWSPADVRFQAENASCLTILNAGHLCVSTRLLITHGRWHQRPAFLDAVRSTMREAPALPAYYPGAPERHARFLDAYPRAERYGTSDGRFLSYLFVPDVAPDPGEPALSMDPFCSVLSEVPIDAPDPARFIDEAVALCNERVWGSLTITFLVHPRSRRDPATAAALDRALTRLRYGNIVFNAPPAPAFAAVSPPWGAYPGNEPHDIGSGSGYVHNSYLLDGIEKAVTYAPWHVLSKPLWFPSHRRLHEVMPRLARFEVAPSAGQLPGLVRATLGG